ncbi:alpha/beta hydrolase [Tabrizicola sp.]|uniref:alpha/beta hydrolase n=1 Tax=Tabrizicola sp. TaxID=2005166 RepID=UPI00262AE41D|nr:alpha/beta hydrolase [Tabrizicola sp.]MDM7931525.1 alpha/beta hydrolase [Tabrizicola sp.]
MRAKAKAFAMAEAPRICRAYGTTIDETILGGVRCLDVSPPDLRVDWPILYGFGGGMVEGSPVEDLPIIAPLSALTGARVIVPDYRLAPEHPWPAALDDGFAVYREIADQPFATVGESAGGNLSLAWMLKAKAEGLRLPDTAALLSPWCDLSNAGDSLTFNEGRDLTLTRRNSHLAAGYYAGANKVDQPLISPIHGSFDTSFPPCLITSGTRDLLLSQAVRLSQRLRDCGATVDLQIWEGLWHVFEWYEDLPEARESIRRVADHLTRGMTAC